MEDIDIKKELQLKNQEMLLNKKMIDLDTAMESLIVFYSNYSINTSCDINNKICQFRGIESNSEQGKIFYNTIISFFNIAIDKLKELINSNIFPIKAKLSIINDEEYKELLTNASDIIINQMLVYYKENASMLCEELVQSVDDYIKMQIYNHISDVMTYKMINMLKDKFMYSIRVINNNYEENKEVIENINEKTIK